MASAAQIPSEKLWGTWPSGVDLEHFAQAHSARIWPTSEDTIRLIYHGSMHYERNLMTLCRAVIRANSDGIPIMVSLVGDGSERAELESFAADTSGIVQIIPTVNYEVIPGLLAQAHLGVLPFPDELKFQVSSPIKLFEYMAAGLPILATRIVCHTDVVGNGGYAIWAEDASEKCLTEALRLAWRSRDSLSEMGQLAIRAANEWTWEASTSMLNNALLNGINNQMRVSEKFRDKLQKENTR
jgi:glycosyltransferase involved in cell wall biosynthesis